MAIIKPILKYPGSKWARAQWIVSHFPAHTVYVEPYMGSAACFFQKEPAASEVLNDLSGNVVNLFRVIREHGQELADLIAFTPWAREEYDASFVPADTEIEQARRFLVRCWQAHGTRLSAKTGWRKVGARGNASTTSLWRQLPDRLLVTIDRLRQAEIECHPALDVIAEYNAPEVLLYVDPPYVLSTRSSVLYEHEMADTDHIALLDLLDHHRGSVVLSGYAHPLYDERLVHWQRITVSAFAEHGKQRTEVLWLNAKAQRRQMSLFEEVL
jgi:DNA adenine methylase